MPPLQMAADDDTTRQALALELVGEQTLWTLTRNAWQAYWGNFRIIVSCALIPVVPYELLNYELHELSLQKYGLDAVAGFAYLICSFPASCALTVVLSDICVGNRPLIRRAFSRIFGRGRWVGVISTGFQFSVLLAMAFALAMVGLFLFIREGLANRAAAVVLAVPVVWLMVRGAFVNAAVAVEGRSDNDAIQRSIDLTKGRALRLIGLLLPTLMLTLLTGVAVSSGLAMALRALGAVEDTEHVAQMVSNLLAQAILWPMYGICVLQLYYEQRVRRESYSVHALSEDLAR